MAIFIDESDLNKFLDMAPKFDEEVPTTPEVTTTPTEPSLPSPYEEEISSASAKYGVPPEIIRSVMYQESRYNPQALSEKGAIGLMQGMPSTARELGFAPQELYKPEIAIEFGTRYLAELKDQFGTWDKAILAYHQGPGNVEAGTIGPIGKTYQKEVLARIGSTPTTEGPTSTSPSLSNDQIADELVQKRIANRNMGGIPQYQSNLQEIWTGFKMGTASVADSMDALVNLCQKVGLLKNLGII
jgi:hypothetical protein